MQECILSVRMSMLACIHTLTPTYLHTNTHTF